MKPSSWEWKPLPPPKDEPSKQEMNLESVNGLSFRNSSSAYSDGGGISEPSLALSLPSDSKSYMERLSLVDLDRMERMAEMIRRHKENNTTTSGAIRIPKRDVSQYSIPESKELAKQQLLSLPPLDLDTSKFALKKLVKETGDSVSSSSPNLAIRHPFKAIPIGESKDASFVSTNLKFPNMQPKALAKQLFEEIGVTKEMISPILGKNDDYHCAVLA